ncbi:hypothetical protein KP509_04G095300 [Ceratopteris richardii]|nr:hypothetical protein KP509_04G095300 [Ceratopteris richardii]
MDFIERDFVDTMKSQLRESTDVKSPSRLHEHKKGYSESLSQGHVYELAQNLSKHDATQNRENEHFAVISDNEDVTVISIDSYLFHLQRHRYANNLTLARLMYAQLCAVGLETHEAVGNHVIPMFIDCGSLPDALRVFNYLLFPNEVSWTSLIVGHVSCGNPKDALHIYEQMQQENVNPKSYTLVAALQACAALKDFPWSLKIHSEAIANGFLDDSFVCNSLINSYAECGDLLQAEYVFNMCSVRDIVSWTSLLAGYVELGNPQHALDCLKQMQSEGVSPCEFTYACSLKACSNLGAFRKGQELHAEATSKGFDQCSHVANALIDLYGKCGSPFDAFQVFNLMPSRDVVSWTAVIAGYAECGPWLEALKLYDQMQIEGVYPNNITLASLIKACGRSGSQSRGYEVHTQVVLKGFDGETIVGNSLVSMYTKCFAFLEANQVFKMLTVKDAVSWTALIAGYTDSGDGLEALNCFDNMQLQYIPADAFTYSCVLKACSIIQDLQKGYKIHLHIIENDYEKDGPVCNALVDMYMKCGSIPEAHNVFDELQFRTVETWTSMIMGYSDGRMWPEVFHLFEQMQSDGIFPSAVTISSVLRACGNTGALERGRVIHKEFVTADALMIPTIANSLMSMYTKCGSLEEARKVFDKLHIRDATAYSVMIKGYGVIGEGKKAIECFRDMLKNGVSPDSVTFTCLLAACCHASLVYEGHALFRSMREDHGIEATLEHYVCMVGLFAKSGHLYEAERFLETFCLPYQRTWAALLSACKNYGEEELGNRSFEQLMIGNPYIPAWYVLMADTFAGSGNWNAASRLEELRKHSEIFKEPASALIEIEGQIHKFTVRNSPSKEVSDMVRSMNSRLKKEGHLPNLDSVLKSADDDEKEIGLCEHAEKLALAFGLIHTSQGQTIRVTKSMRICHDCHETNKFVSQIEKREIILRDDCSIHHFKDGSCSCGDNF